MNHIVGGGENPNPFVIVSADTRMVFKLYNSETLEFDDDTLETHDDIPDKVIKLTDNVLLCSGGMQSVYEPLRDFITGKAEKNFYLDDLEDVLKDAYSTLKKGDNAFIKGYIDSGFLYTSLKGFFRNGNPGEIRLGKGGEIFKNEALPGQVTSRMFSPTEEISDKMDILMDMTEHESGANDLYSHALHHLTTTHALIASQEVETISKTCLVHVLMKKIDGEIVYEQREIDLSNQIREIQEML